jgi:membrane protease YdiL (CAAX protease family)
MGWLVGSGIIGFCTPLGNAVVAVFQGGCAVNESGSPFSAPLPPKFSSVPSLQQKVFFGVHGLRAGWRLLIFFALVVALFSAEGLILRAAAHRRPLHVSFTPGTLLAAEAASFAVIFVASLIVAALEKRSIGVYGLPWRRAFRSEFWWGTALGFASISLLVGALRLARVLRVDNVALRGGDLWRYGLLWTAVFLLVAGFEEFGFRGYTLFTLAGGVGFWPAAILLSCLFGYVHHGNSGETWLGAFSAGEIGLVLCLMLRRSGSLWLPIGFHAAWDWGETFFYGVPDSGQVAVGHFLNTSLAGPAWLTGGSVGPEASWFCILLVAMLWFVIEACLPTAKYPQESKRLVAEAPDGRAQLEEGA